MDKKKPKIFSLFSVSLPYSTSSSKFNFQTEANLLYKPYIAPIFSMLFSLLRIPRPEDESFE